MQTITKPNQRDISKMLAEFWMPHLEACEDLFAHLEHVDRSMKEICVDALKYEKICLAFTCATTKQKGPHDYYTQTGTVFPIFEKYCASLRVIVTA